MAKRRAALRICLELGYQCDTRLESGNLLQDTYFTVSPHCDRPLPPVCSAPLCQLPLPPPIAAAEVIKLQPGSRQQPTAQPLFQPQTQAKPVSYATTASACILYACGICENGGTYK
jgi:hypothetical protein